MNNAYFRIKISVLKQIVKDLVNQGIWADKEANGIRVSEISNQHLLFAHKFLINSIDSLNVSNKKSKFNDETFKLSITSLEGINILLKEIKFRNLKPLPSNVEVCMDFNESLKSKNELSFKSEHIKNLK